MARGPLYHDEYKPQFSGHETFPLRYGWLKKAFDAVQQSEQRTDNKKVFLDEDAIARFGVGKNMVMSMRHWATTSGILKDVQGTNQIITTDLGRLIFGNNGLDPFMENMATLWLVHWHLSGFPIGHSAKSTWFWSFSHFPGITFDREDLVKQLVGIASDQAWSRVAATTIKRDVECFVRTYVARPSTGKTSHEEALESPLTELGLIKVKGRKDGFRFIRGAKNSLGDGVFLYALTQFWNNYSKAKTISFETLAHEPGSPGRVFLLDENDLADRLSNIEENSGGKFRWSETAGLKQVIREKDLTSEDALVFARLDYRPHSNSKAA